MLNEIYDDRAKVLKFHTGNPDYYNILDRHLINP
jgi:hypothetical protein